MNHYRIIAVIALLLIAVLAPWHVSPAADLPTHRSITYEYATIRWSGRENTHVIRPNGNVEFLGAQLDKVAKPNRADDRAFYMNIVMNGLAKEGYEFAGLSNDDIIMRRLVR